MKKGVTLQLNISDRSLYVLIAIGIFLIAGVGVYAYNSGMDPSTMGHSLDEIEPCSEGEVLQTIDNEWTCTDIGVGLWQQDSPNIYYSEGNVGIGTDNPSAGLDVAGTVNIAKSTTSFVALIANSLSGDGNGLLVRAGDSALDSILTLRDGSNEEKFIFRPTGKAYCYGGSGCWGEASSKTFKENIVPISDEEMNKRLQDLINTSLYNYNFKADSEKEVYTGIITEYSPEYVVQENGLTTSPTQLAVWALTALKAEHEKVVELEKRIESLEKA